MLVTLAVDSHPHKFQHLGHPLSAQKSSEPPSWHPTSFPGNLHSNLKRDTFAGAIMFNLVPGCHVVATFLVAP